MAVPCRATDDGQCQLVKRFEKQINGLNIGIKSYLEVNLETNGVYHAI